MSTGVSKMEAKPASAMVTCRGTMVTCRGTTPPAGRGEGQVGRGLRSRLFKARGAGLPFAGTSSVEGWDPLGQWCHGCAHHVLNCPAAQSKGGARGQKTPPSVSGEGRQELTRAWGLTPNIYKELLHLNNKETT